MNIFLSILFSIVMLFNVFATDDFTDGKLSNENIEISNEIVEEFLEETSEQLSYFVYVPNNNADGFDIEIASTNRISSDVVLDELKNYKVLPADVSINNFKIEDGLITIDFNQAFSDIVCSMGTSGESMIVGSVVNTFLNAFQAETVYITVDGDILESGHVIYDFELGFFEL